MSEDSAFGSADPTPTHRSKYSALEFNEDPFKDHRYGDPFDLEGADPFKNQEDPFTAPVSAAFGANVTSGDPFGSTATSNTATNDVDPFGTNWDTVSKTSSTSTAWGTTSSGMDPFGMSNSNNASSVPASNNLDDSFDPFSAKSLAKISQNNAISTPTKIDTTTASKNIDPFGSSSVWNDDPFSSAPVSRSKTSSDAFADFRNFESSVTKSSNAVLGTAPKISGPPPNKSLNSLQRSETTSSVLKTSRHWPSASSTSHESNSSSIPRSRPSASASTSALASTTSTASLAAPGTHSEKEKKNKFKIKDHMPFAKKKDKQSGAASNSKVIKNDLGPSAPPLEAIHHLQMVSEASKKAELDRLERLRQQEERDLAYAIALSKAEAANQQ